MRIIAGELRGRVLAPVQGRTRPTAAKVREAIFNILGPVVPEAQVLDLFAGTGALGIEALSRGAVRAVFVEDHPGALKALWRNLETLGLQDRSRVLPLPAAAALRQLAAQGERFGLVFLDPPYGGGAAAATLGALAGSSLLQTEVWVVAEHSRRETLPESAGILALRTLRRYGDTLVAIYVRTGDGGPETGATTPASDRRS